jgi:hypothetical protein
VIPFDQGDEEAEDVDVERLEWTPNPRQFARYQRREVVTARENLATLKARYGAAFSADTLHSKDTLWCAMQGIG